jgi:hypothetical protein
MFTPKQILEIAESLQPKLYDLLPSDIAESIDQQLTALIIKANNGEPVAQTILELLNQHSDLHPYLTDDTQKQFNPLAGDGTARPRKPAYQCPECNITKAELPQGRIPKCDAHPEAILQRILP